MPLTGRVASNVTLALLVATLFVSQAAPLQLLPGDDAIALSAGDQTAPAIARGGGIFLAVWSDTRGALVETGTGSDIYGMRLAADGTPIDLVPFIVTQAPADQANPQVSWNGQNFLVAWEDLGVSGTGVFYSRYIRGARVSSAGVVLDPEPIGLFGFGSSSDAMFALSSDGTNWAVVAQGTSSGENDVVGVRVSPGGAVLDVPQVVLLVGDYYLRFDLRIASAGGGYLLAWEDLNNFQAMRLGADLAPIGSPFSLVSNFDDSVDLASNGSEYFAVWPAQQPNFTTAAVGTRISADGTILDPAGIIVSGNNSPESNSIPPQVVWNGTDWLVSWQFNGASVARVNSAGQVLDPGGVAVPLTNAGYTAPAPAGGLQMVWDDFSDADYDSYTAAITAGFTAGVTAGLSVGAPAQIQGDVATDGAGWMVVFTSYDSAELRVLAQPLDAAGNPLTVEPVLVDSGAVSGGPNHPAVAWNGSVYLVTWNNSVGGGILAMRLLPDGTPVDPAPLLVMDGFSPDVAALGDVFLVVGVQQHPQLEHTVEPFVRRLRGSDGAFLDAQEFKLGALFASNPAVVELGGSWLVAWQRNVSHDNPSAEIKAAFVGSDGTAAADFLVDSLSTTSMYRGPQLASMNDKAFIVWEDERSSSFETEIVGRFIQADGTLLPGITITDEPGNQFRTGVAWDGAQFVIAYQDQRNRVSDLDALDSRTDLFVSRMAEDGTVIDPQGFVFAAWEGAEIYPTVSSANGDTLIAGSILMEESPFAAMRIAYDIVNASALPVAVAIADKTSGDAPLDVAFDSSGSFDPNGSIVAFDWDFGDGNTSVLASPAHTYSEQGNNVVFLTVTDNEGLQSSTTRLVRTTEPNQPPVAVASADVLSGPPPLAVEFSASGSYDPDGAIGNKEWAFSDGGSYFGSPAYHTFQNAGTYTATLTVFDDRGATGSDTLIIVVGSTSDLTLRSAAIDLGVRPRLGGFAVLGRVAVVHGDGSPVTDGAAVVAEWTRPDGSTQPVVVPANPAGFARFVIAGGSGTYTLTVRNIRKLGYFFDALNSLTSASVTTP